MVRIWMNHWFSTAYNIVNLIKQDDPEFFVIGSNENVGSPIRTVCDEWYHEPTLKDDTYVDYCVEFCREHHVDVFLPRRGMLDISKHIQRFASIGTKVMVDDYSLISVLNHKNEAYELFKKEGIGIVPEYRMVTTTEQFCRGYSELKEQYKQVCFKFVKDEGGKSFRLIDNSKTGYATLFKKQTTRMTYDAAVAALSEKETFPPIMLMPYLPNEEISVDCLKTNSGIIMIPRVKGATRVEAIRYNPDILATCQRFFERIPLEMPCNIQFKYLEGIPYMLEVNTRMSGGVQMACLGSGINIPNIAVNKLLGIDKHWTNNYEEKQVSHNAEGFFLFYERHVVSAGSISCGHGRRHLMRTGVPGINAVIFIDQRLVSMLLRPQSTGHILRALHHASALVIQAQDGRHTVSAGRAFQRRSQFLAIPNAPSRGAGSCRECGRHEGLLFHSRLCIQCARNIM